MKIHAKADWDPEPKRLGPFDIRADKPGIAYVISAVVVIVLLLIGLFSDNYLGPIVLASLVGSTIVGLWLYHRERGFSGFASAPTRSTREDWKPKPQHLVPFGPYGGGQWTGHPIGLVIVIGVLFMGLVSRTPVSVFVMVSLLGGAIVGFFLWLRQR
jgi:hypothetical protein